MLFNSFEFMFGFLPLVLAGYFVLGRCGRPQFAVLFLLCVSVWFYAAWNLAYLPILAVSVASNFWLGRILEERRSKAVLMLAAVLNLSALAYYKYAAFIVETANSLLLTTWPVPPVTIPLGISFFTFTQLAYLVDAYRGHTERADFSVYALFVTYFPHLIAGPILYHKQVIPQLMNPVNHRFSFVNFRLGIVIFIAGLFKKAAIADSLSGWSAAALSQAQGLNFWQAWAGALAYTFQIYFDFSGYSEMAVGLALMLNVRIPVNFNLPYQANSISDFWRRWHMSLSAFLKNYLYIPLGGNRLGGWRTIINLMVTMLLGGLWHGAGWTFVIWGGLHGTYLVAHHLWRRTGVRLPVFAARTLTFAAVVFAWVFFRAQTLADAMGFCSSLAGLRGVAYFADGLQSLPGGQTEAMVLLVLLAVVHRAPGVLNFLRYDEHETVGGIAVDRLERRRFGVAVGFVAGILLFICLNRLAGGVASEFLYFQF